MYANQCNSNTLTGVGEAMQSPLQSALGYVEERQAFTHNLIDRLASRLDAVLSPPQPSNDKAAVRPVGVSPLVERVMSQGESAASIVVRLNDLLDRLTL